MLSDLDQILARPNAPFNFNIGNVQQDPPPFPPYLFRDVLLNPLVIAVTRAILGSGLKNIMYSGNTALPGGTRQPVHPDVGQLWPQLAHPTPPYALVVNIPVVDMDAHNGSTELWPGTHLDTTVSVHDGSVRISQDMLDRRRAVEPPLQPSVRCGSVVIRDIRMWHAGMPNHADHHAADDRHDACVQLVGQRSDHISERHGRFLRACRSHHTRAVCGKRH
jgi:ectoine hydroxylase-related dioxygenase (phytanoyl-CoA dioxygenase family)